jgi:hypothetical protein
MKIAAALSVGQFRSQPLAVLGILVSGVFAAYEAAQYMINDDMTSPAQVATRIVGGATVMAILNDWRNGEPARRWIR